MLRRPKLQISIGLLNVKTAENPKQEAELKSKHTEVGQGTIKRLQAKTRNQGQKIKVLRAKATS